MKIFNKFIEFGNFANNRLQKASFCILLFAASVLAQEFNMNNMPPPEASMHYSLGALTKGSSVTVDITIPDNWHVNANVAADEFLNPSGQNPSRNIARLWTLRTLYSRDISRLRSR